LCDGSGLVTAGENGLGLEANPLCENRFSLKHREDHEYRLQDEKRRFLARKEEIKSLQKNYVNDDLFCRPPET
jgi:hypothetical protein